MRSLVIAAIAALACAGTALAREGAGGVYKCTDADGAVTYATSPCKGAKREFLSREKLEGKITTIEFPKPEVVPPEPSTPEPSKPGPSKPEASKPGASTPSEKAPAGSAAAATVAPPATPAPAVANPKIRTLPIERKLGKD